MWDLFLSRLGHLLVEESRCRDDLTRASGSAGRLGRGGVGGSTGMQRISAAWLLNGARGGAQGEKRNTGVCMLPSRVKVWCLKLPVRGSSRFDCGKAHVTLAFIEARVCESLHAHWAKISNANRFGPTGQCCTHSKSVCVLTARWVRFLGFRFPVILGALSTRCLEVICA